MLSLLTALVALCCLLAWALARGWLTRSIWPFYRPVAWLLTVCLATDLARAALQTLVLSPAREAHGLPYEWPVRAWYHLEQAAHLAWPAAILACAIYVFQRRRPWAVLGGWLAVSAAVAYAYPWLRLERLDAAYVVVSWACCVTTWVLGARFATRDALIQQHVSVMLVALGEFASAGAYILGDPVRDWWIARGAYAAAFITLMCYQIAQIVRYSKWRSS